MVKDPQIGSDSRQSDERDLNLTCDLRLTLTDRKETSQAKPNDDLKEDPRLGCADLESSGHAEAAQEDQEEADSMCDTHHFSLR